MTTTIHPLLPSSSTSTRELTTTISTTTTTNSTIRPSSSIDQLTDALLFQNLRGDAQELGLDSDSLGWAIIQSIHTNQEIGSVSLSNLIPRLQLLTTTHQSFSLLLLLPKNNLNSTHQPSQHTILNHILIVSPSIQTDHPNHTHQNEYYLTNLNGSKGLIQADRILFTSPSTPIDHLLQTNQIHPSLLSTLKLSTSLSNELTSPAHLRFPTYPLLSPSNRTITIPRLNHHHHQPTHNLNLNNSSNRNTSTAQRLASLFTSRSDSEPLTIAVRVIDQTLDSIELDQSIIRAISNRIKDGLESLEENMLSIIQNFISRLSISNQNPASVLFSSSTQTTSLHLASNQEIGEVIQEMYQEIDHALEKEYCEELEVVESEAETRMIIDHTLELIEEVVCLELYDRIFEESLEDQEFSDKIAQLNLLDITLDHLGLDLERREMDDPDSIIAIRTGLDKISTNASVELSRLEDAECRSPRDKVGVFVIVHKLIVDGLSLLPPIPMKKEGITAGVVSGQLSQDAVNYNEVEMLDTIDRTRIPTDPRMMDRTLPMSTPLRPLPKDQPSTSDLLDAMHTNLIDPPAPPSAHPEDIRPRSPDPVRVNKPRPNSSSADLILPILIYLIIKSNPSRLISNLNYVNRFRYQRLIKGETDYCLVNFSVSCEFIKNFVGLNGFEAFQTTAIQATRQDQSADGSTPRGTIRAGYGTFSSSIKRGREKTGNSEVEDALIAASRAVGGVLMGGYQKVISSTLLDAPAAKLGLASGTRSAPRTLEEVKKLIGSGSGEKREGNMNSWGSRVGLLRRNQPNERPDQSPSNPLTASDTPGNGSNAVKRLSSLFQNSPGPSTTLGNPTPSAHPSQTEEDRVTISQRLSSLPGFGRLGHQASRSREFLNFRGTQSYESNVAGTENLLVATSMKATQMGPIERLERCETSDHLLMADIPVLLADYQRLSKIGRDAGLW